MIVWNQYEGDLNENDFSILNYVHCNCAIDIFY